MKSILRRLQDSNLPSTLSLAAASQRRWFQGCAPLLDSSTSAAAASPSAAGVEGCAAIMRINPSADMPRYLMELCYRSCYARELLRARIREPSIELALRELADYTALRGKYPDGYMAQLLEADDVGKIALLLDDFERWYFQLRAPEKIKMGEPWSWFPKARQMRRRFIFHSGPTNSGKTHAALERLIAAKSGVYCAPLKALAAQVWRKIDATSPCDLLIGDERQFGGSAEHVSCTMEMTPVDFQVDVGVIDEIQMIGDQERGWAWTRAVLGLPAKEIHLCGEERALEVVKALLRQTNEDWNITVVKHKRLVGLQLGPSLAGSYRALENGDCVVAFSRKNIFKIKSDIEVAHPNAVVHVIYGGLPFIVRESESDAFNEGVKAATEHHHHQDATAPSAAPRPHVLVTTDAIAYGLNMNIKRIIFSATQKFDGSDMRELPTPLILQVGGRAGRFGMAFGKGVDCEGGLVTTLYPNQLSTVRRAFSSPMPMIPSAGLLPTADILGLFAEMTYGSQSGGQVTFSKIISDFAAAMKYSKDGLLFPCDMSRSVVAIAKYLDEVRPDLVIPEEEQLKTSNPAKDQHGPSLLASPFDFPINDKIIFCFCPMSERSDRAGRLLQGYAMDHATGGPVRVRLDSYLAKLEQCDKMGSGSAQDHLSATHAALTELEWIYRMAEVYGWLSWRFGRTFVGGHDEAKVIKDRCSEEIKRRLASLPRTEKGGVGRHSGGSHHTQNRNRHFHGHGNHRDGESSSNDLIAPIPLTDMGATNVGHKGEHQDDDTPYRHRSQHRDIGSSERQSANRAASQQQHHYDRGYRNSSNGNDTYRSKPRQHGSNDSRGRGKSNLGAGFDFEDF